MLKFNSRISLINYTLHRFIIKNNGDCHKMGQLIHYKIRQVFITKWQFYFEMWRSLENVTILIQCDCYYKLRRLFQNMLAQLKSYCLVSIKASLLRLDYSQCAQLIDLNNCNCTCTFKANCFTSSQLLQLHVWILFDFNRKLG